jgi:hypothetical protein
MALQVSVAVQNARLDAIEATVGASAFLQLYTGSKPANCAAAATGTLVAELALPADWMANASAGSKSKAGTWAGAGSADGDAGYFRIVNNAKSACGLQGTVTKTGLGGDLTLDNTNIANNQAVSISGFTLSDPNG